MFEFCLRRLFSEVSNVNDLNRLVINYIGHGNIKCTGDSVVASSLKIIVLVGMSDQWNLNKKVFFDIPKLS